MAARHPEHDAVRAVVRGWYTAATPDIGISVVDAPYGTLMVSDRTEVKRLVLTEESPRRMGEVLAAATEFFGREAFEVWVDDRERAERLTPALESVGWQPQQDTVMLALVGPVRAGVGPDELTVEDVVDPDGLREWATVKLQGFADNEEKPAADELDAELSVRQAEWPVCRYQLARLAGEAVAILGHYTGEDQMVFLLATRVPFRHCGIARALLARWAAEPDGGTVRSRLINCDDGGPAAALYRTLGFTDEIYWYRRFRGRQ